MRQFARAGLIAITVALLVGIGSTQASPLRETVTHYFTIDDFPLSGCEAESGATIISQTDTAIEIQTTNYPDPAPTVRCVWALPEASYVTEFSGIYDTAHSDGTIAGTVCLSLDPEGSCGASFRDGPDPETTSSGDADYAILVVAVSGFPDNSDHGFVTDIVLNGSQDEVCDGECPEGGGWGPGGWGHGFGYGGGYRPIDEAETLSDFGDADSGQLQTIADAAVHAPISGQISNLRYEADGWALSLLNLEFGYTIDFNKLGTVNVASGDTVEAGCVFGLASSWKTTYFGQPASQVDFNITGSLDDWHSWADSPSDEPCGTDQSAHCVTNNSDLNNDAEGWQLDDGLALNQSFDSIISLSPTGALTQDVTLEADTSYYVTVIAKPIQSTGQLTVHLGDAAGVLDLAGDNADQTLGFAEYTTQALTPSGYTVAPDQYRLRVENTSGGGGGNFLPRTVNITYICVHLGDIALAPPACYFSTNLGEALSDDWITSGGASWEPRRLMEPTGSYNVPNGEMIAKLIDISAFSDTDVDYKVTVNYQTVVAVGDDPATQVLLDIRDPDDDSQILDIGAINSDSVLDGMIGSTHELTFTVDMADHIVGNLTIENDTDSITSDATAIRVFSVCLSPIGTNGIWPGYADADTSLGGLNQNCDVCVLPTTLDVAAWLGWLGCLIRYFVGCIIIGLINQLIALVNFVVAGVGQLGRWLGAAIAVVASWAWNAGLRLFSQFTTWLIPIANAVLAWLFAQPFFRSLLDAITIAGLWLDAMFAMLLVVFNVFASAMNLLAAIGNLIVSLWTSFVTAATDTSLTAAQYIDCSDTGDPFYGLCLGMATVNFFVAKVLMLAVLTTVFAFMMGWQQVQAAFDEFEEAGALLG